MTFLRIKNLTSKNLLKISKAFTIAINLTPSNAWRERVSVRPWKMLMILNLVNFLYLKPEILEAIDTIRTKKERTDVNSIYKELFRNQASNIDEKQ